MPTPMILFGLGGKFDQNDNENVHDAALLWQTATGQTVSDFELTQITLAQAVVSRSARDGYEPLIAVGPEYVSAVEAVSADHPDTQFVLVGAPVDLPNVLSILFDVEAASFAAGYLAATASSTGVVGFIGGQDTDMMVAAGAAFAAGAHAAVPGTQAIRVMTGTDPSAWADPARGAALARDMILDDNVDVITSPSGSTAFGVYDTVAELGARSIGIDWLNLNRYGDSMITSLYPNMEHVMFDVLSGLDGITGDTLWLGLGNDGITYVDDGTSVLMTPDYRAALEAAPSAFATLATMPTEGPDTLDGGSGADRLEGLGGSDVIDGMAGPDTLDGGTGFDTLTGGAGHDLLIGGSQGDDLSGDAGNDTLIGNDGHDALAGAVGSDLIRGHKGNDTLGGGDGDDTLHGDTGDDIVTGGNGADLAWLGSGADVFHDNTQDAPANNDTVQGGAGDDTIWGGNGFDDFRGNAGADLIRGGKGWDSLFGGDQGDTLQANDGNDLVYGGRGADYALLGNGFDSWWDDAQTTHGDDTVFGGGGWDTIRSAGGDDSLTGGAGSDLFVFVSGIGNAVIGDFDTQVDRLSLDDGLWGGARTPSAFEARATLVDDALVLELDTGATLTFQGLTTAAGLSDALEPL